MMAKKDTQHKIVKVCFDYEGDGCTALYENGKCVGGGDDYHDKIDRWIDGWVAGRGYEKDDLLVLGVSSEHLPDDFCGDWPEVWPDKKYAKVAVKL